VNNDHIFEFSIEKLKMCEKLKEWLIFSIFSDRIYAEGIFEN
jgi:hypothetical protein